MHIIFLCRLCFIGAILLLIVPRFAQCEQPEFRFTSVDERLLTVANELDERIEKKGLIVDDSQAESYVTDIGARLLTETPTLERVNFRFHIIRDPMVNAFALPNGSVYINTGLIAALRNEAQLASVLSHEVTHVTGRHAYIENRSIRRKNVAMDVLWAAAAAGGVRGGTAFGQSILLAAQISQIFIVATVYGYSRELERDADGAGFALLTHANYDANAMTEALEILDERIEFEPTQPFWRTHPKLQERIGTSKARALKQNTGHSRDFTEGDYLEHVASVVRYNVELDLESRRSRTAVDRAQRLVDWAPSDSKNITLLADAYVSLGAKTARPSGEELSVIGKKENRKRLLKRTAEEEQRDLQSLPNGQRTLVGNRSKAEALYRQAIRQGSLAADPHRGLGMLYEEESKPPEAAVEYRQYLNLAPADAPDRLRIERRLNNIQSKIVPK